MRMFQSVSGHSSEQSTAHYSSRPTVSQLKGVSDTISNWFENRRPQRTQISTVTGALLRSKLGSNGLRVDRNRKFSERIFSTPAILKATSKLFGSLGCSDDKNWLDVSSIFFKILYIFAVQFCFRCIFTSFHSTRSDARVKFDSGVIFLDQSQFFATHSKQWNCFILYIRDHAKWLFSCKGGAKGRLSRYVEIFRNKKGFSLLYKTNRFHVAVRLIQ